MQGRKPHRGFTLIELLVVIAIIALLISILLPSLSSARLAARSLKTASNARSVMLGVATYLTTSRSYPPHYVYGADETSTTWDYNDQQVTNPNLSHGYVHWSYSLFADGSIPEEAFTNPLVPTRGGAPATNPGIRPEDWEDDQQNDQGGTKSAPNALPTDRQVKRIGFGGNGAIFPRNKFYASGGERKNNFVNDSMIAFTSSTIILGEYMYSKRIQWGALQTGAGATGGGLYKTHRPFTPFVGVSAGDDVYSEPMSGGGRARFRYPNENELLAEEQCAGAIDGSTDTTLNAVGRQAPGSKDKFGGMSNFAYIDGHVEAMTVLNSIKKRQWGDRFYSLTGDNQVEP